jgi:hypothetical protein
LPPGEGQALATKICGNATLLSSSCDIGSPVNNGWRRSTR